MSDISDTGSFDLGLANIASSNYGPNAVTSQANTAANTQNTQAATQGQQIQNANAALNLQALRIGLSQLYKMPGWQADQADQSGTSSGGTASPSNQIPAPTSARGSAAPSPAPTSARGSAAPSPAQSAQGGQSGQSAPIDPADDEVGESVAHPETLDQNLRRAFTVNPLGTPDEVQNILQAGRVSALTKNPAFAQMAGQQREIAVAQRQFQAKQVASTQYEEATAVVAAGEKSHALAWHVMEATLPDSAFKIEKMHPKESGESDSEYEDRLGGIAADTAAHFAGHVWQYSGREHDTRSDGVVVDKLTQLPVAGVTGAGLSPKEYSAAVDDANTPVSIKNSDGSESQVPKWEYAKSQGMNVTSAADYVKQKIDQQQAIAQHKQQVQDHFNAQRTQQQIQAGIPPQSGAQPGAQPGAPQPGAPGAAPQPAAAAPPAAPADPVLRQALTDPEYKLQVPKVIKGTSQTPAQADQAKTIVQARTDLLKDSQDATSAAAQSMQYMQAAKAILNSKQVPTTGAYGAMIAKASALLPGQSVDATNYAEVAKYLGNAALAQAKGIYGARMTQSEVGLQLNELSPSTKMTDAAIRDLLDTNIRSAAYTINAARKSKAYLASGGDPQKYSDWLENYYPRAQTVNNPPTRPDQQTSGGRSIVRTGSMNGRKVVQYSDGSTAYAE